MLIVVSSRSVTCALFLSQKYFICSEGKLQLILVLLMLRMIHFRFEEIILIRGEYYLRIDEGIVTSC